MITGIGMDIIEVERVAEKVTRENGFKEKIFAPREIAFCESTADRGQHYAVRFAAKEAFLKATGQGLHLGFELHEIEVLNSSTGKPEINLQGNFKSLAIENGWNKIHVSLSHLKNIACAVVIIEQ